MRKLTEEDTDLGKLIEVDEFVGMCIERDIEDSDGYGRLVYDCDDVEDKYEVLPSDYEDGIFEDDNITHILWFDC